MPSYNPLVNKVEQAIIRSGSDGVAFTATYDCLVFCYPGTDFDGDCKVIATYTTSTGSPETIMAQNNSDMKGGAVILKSGDTVRIERGGGGTTTATLYLFRLGD